MPPKEKPKLEPHGKQRAESKKSTTSDEGTNWLMEAWRKAAYTPFDKCAIAARAACGSWPSHSRGYDSGQASAKSRRFVIVVIVV